MLSSWQVHLHDMTPVKSQSILQVFFRNCFQLWSCGCCQNRVTSGSVKILAKNKAITTHSKSVYKALSDCENVQIDPYIDNHVLLPQDQSGIYFEKAFDWSDVHSLPSTQPCKARISRCIDERMESLYSTHEEELCRSDHLLLLTNAADVISPVYAILCYFILFHSISLWSFSILSLFSIVFIIPVLSISLLDI